MISYHTGDIIQGEIQFLAFGGSGILRTSSGMVVFVPFTAPKDQIECQLVQVKKNYAEAKLVKLNFASPDRISPRCPYFGTCGGCQLQHLNYSTQSEYKHKSVKDALRKVYPDADIQMHPAKTIWGYRRHITLTLEPAPKGFKAGYITLDNSSLLEVEQCPIFLTEDNSIFEIVAEMAKALNSTKTKTGKLKIYKINKKYHFVFDFDVIPSNFKEVCSALPIESNPFFSIDVGDTSFYTKAGLFLQNHEEMSSSIYTQIKEIISNIKPKILLDLYCGIGIASLLSAPFAEQIYGVEWNKTAIEMAKKNKAALNVKNVQFEADDVERALKRLLVKKPQTAIVNPPRIGLAKEVVEMLGSSSLREIIYVSCQPATLARDLNILKKYNFILEKGSAFDMFPQTGHVETLVSLKRPSV